MRIVHHRLGEGRENTVYDVNKLGNSYHISERNVDIEVGPCFVYFIAAIITFISTTAVLIICRRNQPLEYYKSIIEMYIYTVQYFLFGWINYLFPQLFTSILLNLFVTPTIICIIITNFIFLVFG